MTERRWTVPNLITVARIVACPAVFLLALRPGVGWPLIAFVLFLAAALSDLWDGYLARKPGWITDLGKLLDPLADKAFSPTPRTKDILMWMLSTKMLPPVGVLVPIYLISQRGGATDGLPWIGALPLWVVLVLFGRELLVTLLRQVAKRQGLVIAAGASGKRKALLQNFFVGGGLLWFPLGRAAVERGWVDLGSWSLWYAFHGLWLVVTLALALVLAVYSLGDYLWKYRSVLGAR